MTVHESGSAQSRRSTDTGWYRQVLGRFPSGITVITTMDADGPTGFTCQSFAALSLDPPLVVFAPSRASETWPRIAVSGHFCVNVLHRDQVDLCRRFASKAPDKFAGVEWRAGSAGQPVLAGTVAWLECRVADIFDGGDHLLVTGSVLDLDVEPGEPLIFHGGSFHRLESLSP